MSWTTPEAMSSAFKFLVKELENAKTEKDTLLAQNKALQSQIDTIAFVQEKRKAPPSSKQTINPKKFKAAAKKKEDVEVTSSDEAATPKAKKAAAAVAEEEEEEQKSSSSKPPAAAAKEKKKVVVVDKKQPAKKRKAAEEAGEDGDGGEEEDEDAKQMAPTAAFKKYISSASEEDKTFVESVKVWSNSFTDKSLTENWHLNYTVSVSRYIPVWPAQCKQVRAHDRIDFLANIPSYLNATGFNFDKFKPARDVVLALLQKTHPKLLVKEDPQQAVALLSDQDILAAFGTDGTKEIAYLAMNRLLIAFKNKKVPAEKIKSKYIALRLGSVLDSKHVPFSTVQKLFTCVYAKEEINKKGKQQIPFILFCLAFLKRYRDIIHASGDIPAAVVEVSDPSSSTSKPKKKTNATKKQKVVEDEKEKEEVVGEKEAEAAAVENNVGGDAVVKKDSVSDETISSSSSSSQEQPASAQS